VNQLTKRFTNNDFVGKRVLPGSSLSIGQILGRDWTQSTVVSVDGEEVRSAHMSPDDIGKFDLMIFDGNNVSTVKLNRATMIALGVQFKAGDYDSVLGISSDTTIVHKQ